VTSAHVCRCVHEPNLRDQVIGNKMRVVFVANFLGTFNDLEVLRPRLFI
jgi:hypothetical protein